MISPGLLQTSIERNIMERYQSRIVLPKDPDLNITMVEWDHLGRERNKRQPSSKEELWKSPLRSSEKSF